MAGKRRRERGRKKGGPRRAGQTGLDRPRNIGDASRWKVGHAFEQVDRDPQTPPLTECGCPTSSVLPHPAGQATLFPSPSQGCPQVVQHQPPRPQSLASLERQQGGDFRKESAESPRAHLLSDLPAARKGAPSCLPALLDCPRLTSCVCVCVCVSRLQRGQPLWCQQAVHAGLCTHPAGDFSHSALPWCPAQPWDMAT